jgi:hypothetical protein
VDWTKSVFLPKANRESRMRVQIVIPETDDSSVVRLGIGWRVALFVMAHANSLSHDNLTFRTTRVRAENALDLYFAELESCLRGTDQRFGRP